MSGYILVMITNIIWALVTMYINYGWRKTLEEMYDD